MTIIDECSLNGNSTRTFYAPDFLVHLIHDLVSKFCPSLNFHKIYAPSRLQQKIHLNTSVYGTCRTGRLAERSIARTGDKIVAADNLYGGLLQAKA